MVCYLIKAKQSMITVMPHGSRFSVNWKSNFKKNVTSETVLFVFLSGTTVLLCKICPLFDWKCHLLLDHYWSPLFFRLQWRSRWLGPPTVLSNPLQLSYPREKTRMPAWCNSHAIFFKAPLVLKILFILNLGPFLTANLWGTNGEGGEGRAGVGAAIRLFSGECRVWHTD